MFKRICSLLFFVLLLNSCQFIEKQFGVDNKSQMLDTLIDYNKVDVLPSFAACDSIFETSKKNRCFNKLLYKHFSERLLSQTFSLSDSIHERVRVRIQIGSDGYSSLLEIASTELVKKQLPTLDSLIKQSVLSLPKMTPAIKKGIYVATEYEIPIVVKLN